MTASRVVRRKGRAFVINKKNPRFKVRQAKLEKCRLALCFVSALSGNKAVLCTVACCVLFRPCVHLIELFASRQYKRGLCDPRDAIGPGFMFARLFSMLSADMADWSGNSQYVGLCSWSRHCFERAFCRCYLHWGWDVRLFRKVGMRPTDAGADTGNICWSVRYVMVD